MMDDHDLEARLRKYWPAGPPPELRARVTDAGSVARPLESLGVVPGPVEGRSLQPSGRSGLAWLPAVAALLLATIFYWLAANDRARLFAQFPATDGEETIDLHLENQP